MSKRTELTRAFPLEDIAIRSGGEGRTVVAYAAMFDAPYEVSDWDGHYFEQINRSAFDAVIAGGLGQTQCLFNHGMTVHSTPSDRYSMPLGTPVEVRAEERGLLTVTEYAKTALADEALELIRSGAIRAQSFRGAIVRSQDIGSRSGLRLRERQELGLRDYGPAPFAVNLDAEFVGIRSVTFPEVRSALSDDELSANLAAALADRFGACEVDDIASDEPLVVYRHDGRYFGIGFTLSEAGEVALLGDPTEVQRSVAYTQVSPSAPSDSPAPTGTTAPAEPAIRSVPLTGDLETLTLAQAQRRRRSA